jgi:hypothetical protein
LDTEPVPEITPEKIERVRQLIADRDEVNLEWLRVVTQFDVSTISRIVIREMGMVVLEGTILSQEKAEKRLLQKQQSAQEKIDREAFRQEEVELDMVKLREQLWTARFPDRVLGQDRHQFCPIWQHLQNESSAIILRYDWIKRLDKSIKNGEYNEIKEYELKQLIDHLGNDFKGQAWVIFAQTYPRDTVFGKNEEQWILFLIREDEGGLKLQGLDMLNVLKLSQKFRVRRNALRALDEYIELVHFVVTDPSVFQKVIIAK